MKGNIFRLAVVSICLLTSYSVDAQQVKTSTMKLTGWGGDNPSLQLGKQMKAVVDYYKTESGAMTATRSVLTDSPLVPVPAKGSDDAAEWSIDITKKAPAENQTASFGYGLITDGTLRIDFDYEMTRTAGNSLSTSQKCYTCRWAYSTQYVPEIDIDDNLKAAGLNIYPGVGMRFTAPGKRIKRLVIHTGLPTAQAISNQWHFQSEKSDYNLQSSTVMGGDFSGTNADPETTIEWRDVDGMADVVITSNQPFGTTDGLILRTLPYGNKPIILTSNSKTNSGTSYQNEPVFNIASVDVEYYEEKPFTVESDGHQISTRFERYSAASDAFEPVASNVALPKEDCAAIEKVRIGNVIVEINTGGAAGAGMSLNTTSGLGIFAGTKFRMYLDPDMADRPAKVYAYTVKARTGTTSVQISGKMNSGVEWNYPNSRNASISRMAWESGNGTVGYAGVGTKSAPAMTPGYSFRLVNEDGIAADGSDAGWVVMDLSSATDLYNISAASPSTSSAFNQNVVNGTTPVVFIAGIDVEASTDEIPLPATGAPVFGTGPDRAVLDGDVYRFLLKTTLTPTAGADKYLRHSFYYIVGDEALTAASFDKSKATKIAEGEAITVDRKCVVSVLTVGEYSKGEVDGDLRTYAYAPVGIELFDDVVALNRPENDGKLVAINCLVNPIEGPKVNSYGISGYDLSHNSAATGYQYNLYARDIHGNAVKFTTLTSATNTALAMSPVSFASGTRTYLVETGLVGVFHYNDGRPELRVIDEMADKPYDYSALLDKTFVVTNDAAARQRAGVETLFANSPIFITEPSKATWGSFVRMRHLTYKEKSGDDYLFTTALGADAPVRTYISKNLIPAVGSEYTVTGIVEYDEVNGYFMTPTYIVAAAQPIVIDGDDDTKKTTITGATVLGNDEEGMDLTVAVTLLTGKLTFSAYNSHPTQNMSFIIADLNDGGKKSSWGSIAKQARSTINVPSDGLKWIDGVARIAVTLRYGSGVDVINESDPVYIKIYDDVAAGQTVETLAELRDIYGGKDPADVTDAPFVTFTESDAGKYGRIAVAGVYDKYILIRDIPDGMTSGNDKEVVEGTDLTGKNDYIIVKADEGWLGKVSNKLVYPVIHRYINASNMLSTDSKLMVRGDALQTLVARVTPDANGNWMLDATGTANLFSAYKKYQPSEEPRMSEEIDRITKPEEVTALTVADLGKLVVIKDVTIARNTYEAGTSGTSLAWNYLMSAESAASHQAAINGAASGAEFTVTGLVMRGAGNSIVIEVISLDGGYDRVLDVCGHKDHATYYEKQEFAGTEKLVKVNGVRITRTGDTAADYAYQLKLKTPVSLGWTTFDDRATADMALINGAIAAGETADDFIVTGFLTTDGGVRKLDVITLEKVAVTTDQLRVYPYWTKKDYSDQFHSYFVPGFAYNPRNLGAVTLYSDATEVYNIFYKLLRVSEIDPAVLPENPGNLTAEQRQALMEDLPLVKFDPAAFPKVDEDCFIYAESCAPGQTSIQPSGVKYIMRRSGKAATLAETIALDDTEAYVHYTGNLRVLGANAATGMMALTDGSTIISAYVPHKEEITDDVVAGAHIGEMVLSWKIKGQYYRVNSSKIDNVNVPVTVVTPAEEISGPAAVQLTGAETIADVEQKPVMAVGARIAMESGNSYVLTLGSFKMPVTTHLGWDPAMLSDNPDAEYIVKGYVFKRIDPYTGEPLNVVNPANAVALADLPAAFTHEIWATGVEFRGQTATPAISVAGAESVADGKAVTINPVTVTITCGSEGAGIEYSLDGTGWKPYTGALTIGNSCTVSARATAAELTVSKVASIEIVREYVSADVSIDPAEMAGYTAVTIRPVEMSMNPSAFTIHYTLDGTEPTAGSDIYTTMLEIENPCTVKAILIEKGAAMRPGAVAVEIISSIVSGDVKFSVRKGDNESFVTITPASDKHLAAKRRIFYAFNLDLPFDEWTDYTEGTVIRLTGDATIYAYMTEDGKEQGDWTSCDVTVAPAPTDPVDPDDPKDPDTPADPDDPTDPGDSAIDSISGDAGINVAVEDGAVVVTAPEGTTVEVYSITGSLLRSTRAHRIDGLPHGVYILRIAGTTFKLRL